MCFAPSMIRHSMCGEKRRQEAQYVFRSASQGNYGVFREDIDFSCILSAQPLQKLSPLQFVLADTGAEARP